MTEIHRLDFDALLERSGVLKRCTQCGEQKALSEFHRHKRHKDGRQSECKACVAKQKRAYHEANREQIAEQQRAYHEANREHRVDRMRAYYRANAEAERKRKRAYRAANLGRERARCALRHAGNQVAAWADLQRITEFYSAAPQGHEVDHVIPFTGKHKGKHVISGLHTIENLQYLTRSQNAKKSNRFKPILIVHRPDLFAELEEAAE